MDETLFQFLRQGSVDLLKDWLDLSPTWANVLQSFMAVILVFFLSWAVYKIGKLLLRSYLPRLARRTKNKWDDALVDNKVFITVSYYFFGFMFITLDGIIASESVRVLIKNLTGTYFTIVTVTLISAILDAAYAIYMKHKKTDAANLNIYIQVIKVLLYSIGVITIISFFADKNFMDILKGLGAMLTILLIVYKDSIMGFVAGINLSAYKMLQVGDWIVVPGHHADGTVIEVALGAVKVQNWDNTITTIPPYNLVSGSFINWKGMEQSGGRRIKRSINIDIDSVRFLTNEEVAYYANFDLLKDFIAQKQQLIAQDNAGKSQEYNQRRLTNTDIFMQYALKYLDTTGYVHPDMTCMVRQLQSTEKGLPIEVYFFSTEQRWVFYEQIQSELFSHLFAVANEFGLKVYQTASSNSVNHLSPAS